MGWKSGWDIGMGTKYFYLFVSGRKKPVSRILVDDAYEKYKDGYEWGKAEYKRYLKKLNVKSFEEAKEEKISGEFK